LYKNRIKQTVAGFIKTGTFIQRFRFTISTSLPKTNVTEFAGSTPHSHIVLSLLCDEILVGAEFRKTCHPGTELHHQEQELATLTEKVKA